MSKKFLGGLFCGLFAGLIATGTTTMEGGPTVYNGVDYKDVFHGYNILGVL